MRSLKLLVALLVLVACSGSEPGSAAAPSLAPSASAPHSSATPTPVPVTAAPATAAPATAPPAGFIGLGGCPPYSSGQHPLGSIGAPGAGVHADPLLDWQGCGSVVVPAGTSRFMTGNNWQLGYAMTCPNDLSYGPGGMGPNVTINELLIGGGTGADAQAGAGPWTDSGGAVMAHGGNYQLRITAIDLRCRWHIAVFPAT